MSQAPPWIGTWTEFPVPESETIFDIGAPLPPCESRKKWIDAICPLTEAPGYEQAVWARSLERPETVVMFTAWRSREALDGFRTSPAHARYWRGLSAFGTPTKTELALAGPGFVSMLHGAKFVSALRVSFRHDPADGEEEEEEERRRRRRERVRELHGLVPRFAERANPGGVVGGGWSWNPLMKSPVPLWADDNARPEGVAAGCDDGGSVVDVLLWFHFWKNAEMEEEWKRTGVRSEVDDEDEEEEEGIASPPLSAVQYFEQRIRDLGALEWTEEHYGVFRIIPPRFNGEPVIGKILRDGVLPPHIFGKR